MAVLKAFQCIRPAQGLEGKIAALPYDVYSREEALLEVQREEASFLKIDRAETQFDESVSTYDARVYQRAHDTLWDMVADGFFVKEQESCYYLYELVMDGRSQTGIVGCASIDDYERNVIKKHENTRAEKEEDRIRHVDICNAQTGPIFLAYRSNDELNEIIRQKKQETPLYDFISPDQVIHKVWKISDCSLIEKISSLFEKIQDVYIADGHHRAASAVKVGLKRRCKNPNYTGEEEFNYFLSVLFPDEQLLIMDYNRVVKDLNGFNKEEILEKIKDRFFVEQLGVKEYKPDRKGRIGMYLDGEWYKLEAKPECLSDDPVEGLDVSVLQNEILNPILGIQNPKTDGRIDFVGGIRGLKELERRVHTDCKIAFAMYPTSIEELFGVADAGMLMPPKSTWFEPKLRSGLFIHELD